MCEGTMQTIIGLMAPATLASLIADIEDGRYGRDPLNYDAATIAVHARQELVNIVGNAEAETMISHATSGITL